MKIAVIHESQKVSEASKELLLEIKNRGHTAYYIRPSKLNGEIDENGIQFNYAGKNINLDGGILRNFGFLVTMEQLTKRIDVLEEIERSGVTLINPVRSMLLARDKFGSLIKLKQNKIPVPPTALVEDPFEAMRLAEKWGEVVIKPVMGSLGLGAVKASSADIVFRVAKAILSVNQPVYIQKYVKKPDRDIRAFVVGGRLLGTIYRISPSNWKTNVAQGAIVQMLKPPSEVEEIAIKATEVLGLEYSGIDIVEDEDGSYKILEVNAAPLWKGFMTATNINPAKYIVDHLIRKIKK
ncbi:RimK family alpha-L-glutamate ligase [Acidianus sulfidivorans JP7]|uniref:RimK family alpha-L-glutamate ligase n=1 Tax=Acidianus sulfidivorans JP7 TaxID=619593 RepID=A0A2U9IL06_9CREN|nr:RimK family alpha-L-glutamate ligase [Acidianus sulfidivorans]AWR96690.1 RimK family alpha-L-glutamate ligase [Acidianus sulfidivorans JP7]